jgi:hypothetical protein
MSKISISLNSEVPNAALMHIKRITSLGLNEIRQNVGTGQPFFNALLFYNDHDDVAQKIRDLISTFNSNSVEASFFELEEDEELNQSNRDISEISSDTLLNILEAHDLGIAKTQERIDLLGEAS